MPDPRPKPVAASDSSASDEASKLELYLQRQLEEDIARIFDESIYSDLEVVCGKLKILTHSCILKARTNIFYRKLEAILHVNIGREIFDEIYSFISDAYTECDIKNQEKEILIFLKSKISTKSSKSEETKTKENTDDIDVFLTPNCRSPHKDNKCHQISCLSPSTELTKEYYALVHIERNLLEQELIEQDALSNAFHTIIQSQDRKSRKGIQRNKPTSLTLISSHSPKTVKHSNHCDIYSNLPNENVNLKDFENKSKTDLSTKTCQSYKVLENNLSKSFTNDTFGEKILDPTYSPDSLITDDPSSSSDYLSAAYACSPTLGSSGCLHQLNVGESSTKMENLFTSSDSGLENTGMLESLNSHKDVTLTDISLTESTLHDFTTEESNQSQETISGSEADFNHPLRMRGHTGPSSLNGISGVEGFQRQRNVSLGIQNDLTYCKSSKEEKQRQNEEIVILESSSVSSETGSWESVFPPKIPDKEICDKFIQCERQYNNYGAIKEKPNTSESNLKYEKLLIKNPTPCFIDAASLADEEQVSVHSQNVNKIASDTSKSDLMPTPSKPVPCSTVNKLDISPGDWSESNDNEDSLEQGDNKDTDSIQKDLSPTIFEMTPLTEDSLSANIIPNNKSSIETHSASSCANEKTSSTVYMGTTPHNSIMSLKTSSLKQYESEESENDIIISRESYSNFRSGRYNESSPIVSEGTSIEDVHTPKLGIQNSSPLMRRKIHNTPIVTGASFLNEDNDSLPKTPKPVSCISAWIVDMSNPRGIESEKPTANFVFKKPGDRNCENLKNEIKSSSSDNYCKSRSSLDSDSSEKSSHKFYIDLSSLPDPLPPEKPVTNDNSNEKKNMFSMYIDLGESSILKEMPSRLSSSLSNKKQGSEIRNSSMPKSPKSVSNEKKNSTSSKPHDYSMSFERYESLCNDPNLTISEIISIPEPPMCTKSHEFYETESNKVEKPSLRRMNGDKSFMMNTVNVIHEETINAKDQSVDLFVKLSDLDKPTIKSDIFEREIFDPRMTRSIPEDNWPEQNVQTASSRSSEVISSFHSENALSLNRLFPHLKNEFSRSMPISLSGRTRSPLRPGVSSSVGEIDEQASDVSEISSIQSSMCRSVIENSTTEETSQTSSLIGNCQSRLGQDLLRMFLEEIAPDVIVEVSGKRIKAHKCILSSRCQYFAGILSGGWVESAGNVIVLPPFSFNVVHFALCHIYSGLSTIPDSISIVELATIADMLGLEGLKEAIMFTLKAKYCHHFHRPCQVCTAGVLECFPLSSVYGLDDLYRKCLRWITKYFTKVWPTKAFATLPKELLDKCYQEHIVNLSTENLIDTVYGCGITVASLQNSRWAESVGRMCRRMVNAAAHFAAPRLFAVLQVVASAPDAPQPAKQALDDCLAAAIEWAPPDETCLAYAFLSNLVKEIRSQHSSKPDLITNGNQISKVPEPSNLLFTHASSWRLQCEGALVRAAPRVVGTQAFKELPSDLRRRLRELGCIMYGPQAIPLSTCPTLPPDRKSKSAYHNKPNKTVTTSATRSLDMEKVRNSFVPYKPKPVTVMGSKDKLTSNSELRDIKKTNKVTAPKVRTTKAQEERAKFNQSKSLTSQDRVVNNKSVAARPHLFENTKPRYLEPRCVKEKEKAAPPKSFVNKLVSSSESSRNSSPVQCRTTRTSRMTANQKCEHKAHAMSQDSLATTSRPRTAEPFTDSLSESQNSNRYATYTKIKRTSKGSVESVMSKCQGLSPSSLLNANVKTKIPVYLNQNSISANGGTTKQVTSVRMLHVNTHSNAKGKTKSCDRKISGSLMNATKSSSAKIVPKVSKESQMHTHKQKQSRTGTKHTTRREDSEKEHHIPAMERSGTFLKDEPTFGDKTTNIDKAL